MAMSQTPDRMQDLMTELRLCAPDEAVMATPLTGGVSSDIVVVETSQGQFCVKFALARLKVAADWRVPVGRNAAEFDWLTYVSAINPALVPRLYGQSQRLGGFAMEYLPSGSYPNWKAEMMAGRVDERFAAALQPCKKGDLGIRPMNIQRGTLATREVQPLTHGKLRSKRSQHSAFNALDRTSHFFQLVSMRSPGTPWLPRRFLKVPKRNEARQGFNARNR
jgi:hypothetical protein